MEKSAAYSNLVKDFAQPSRSNIVFPLMNLKSNLVYVVQALRGGIINHEWKASHINALRQKAKKVAKKKKVTGKIFLNSLLVLLRGKRKSSGNLSLSDFLSLVTSNDAFKKTSETVFLFLEIVIISWFSAHFLNILKMYSAVLYVPEEESLKTRR